MSPLTTHFSSLGRGVSGHFISLLKFIFFGILFEIELSNSFIGIEIGNLKELFVFK